MISTVDKIINCVGIPYVVLYCLLFTRASKRFIFANLLLVAFFIIWRTICDISSSRYCLTLISFIYLSFALFLKKEALQKNNRTILFVLLLFLVGYNTVSNYVSSRNLYIFDVREYTEKARDIRGIDSIVIFPKEFNRLGDFEQKEDFVEFDETFTDLTEFYKRKYLWNKEVLYIVGDIDCPDKQYDNHRTKLIGCHYKDRKKQKAITLFQHSKYLPEPKEIRDILPAGAFLKVYDSEFDYYAYQHEKSLLIVINKKTPTDIKVICNIYPVDPKKLPQDLISHGYDNQSFYMRSKKAKLFGTTPEYNVYYMDLNKSYDIQYIKVGLGKMPRLYHIVLD